MFLEPVSYNMPEQVSVNFLPSSDLAIERAKASLMNYLSASHLDSVNVISCRTFIWPDSSLGCPKEGESYLQVRTPGYIIVFEVAGEIYTMHIDWPGNRIVSPDFY